MKALGKLLGLLLLGLLLLLFALGFALTHLFDPNDYKEDIQQLARERANLELSLNGDIGWSLFPWLGLEVRDVTLASSQSPEQPFADLQTLGFSVRVLPLLRREVEMSDIRLDGLNLNLHRNAQGHGNWEGIGPGTSANATPAPEAGTDDGQPEAETSSRSSRPMKLDIDSLNISNSRIDYQDDKSDLKLTVEGINLKTGAIRENTSIPLRLEAFFGTNQPLLRARAELETQLRFDLALERYQLENTSLNGELSGQPLQGKTLNFSAQGQLLVDLAAQIAEWNNLKLSANQLRALGDLKVRDLQDKANLEGALSIAALDLRSFLTDLGQELPAMASADTLKHLELAGQVRGNLDSFLFEDLKLQLDESHFSGRLGLDSLKDKRLLVQLKGDKLNLDRYLAPVKPASADSERKAAVASAGNSGTTALPQSPTRSAWDDAPVLPIERLRSLNLQADLSIGQLTLRKFPLGQAQLKLNARNGLLRVEQLRADLYGGQFSSNASLDLRNPIVQLAVQQEIKRIPLEKVLQTLDIAAPVQGTLNLQSTLKSSGNSQLAWVEGLNGTASFSLLDGLLPQANLEQQLCQGIALLNRKSITRMPESRDTPFRDLKGSLNIRNGIAHNPDLVIRIPGLTLNGKGDLDLRVLGLDYFIGLLLEGDQRDMPDPACQINKRYVGLEWPLQCRGPLELGAKACRLDKDGLGKIAARLAGDKLSEKLEEKLGDKVSPELRDALKGLFKR